jgi:hypothetical protein
MPGPALWRADDAFANPAAAFLVARLTRMEGCASRPIIRDRLSLYYVPEDGHAILGYVRLDHRDTPNRNRFGCNPTAW